MPPGKKKEGFSHPSVVILVEFISAYHLLMVVEAVVGCHCRCADERMSRAGRDRHPKVADHLHGQVSWVNRFSCHGDLTSTQDTIPLLRDDLGEVMRSRMITLFRKGRRPTQLWLCTFSVFH